jgi:anionic cell wall polymer biosynthesis LytR-Cps2A-Psr (LCP) family protein
VFGQLALSYTYGEGLEDSCENAKKAISDLLNGISIDHYVAMSMDAIALINDGVGGVTVNVTEDFSQVDASIPMGKVTLNGSQALSYVQSRMNVGNQLNISRMGRHKEYMQGLMDALDAKAASGESFVVNLYEEVSPYMVTDCSVNTISGLLNRCSEYTLKEIVSPEGDNVQGEEYYEFYIDAEKLDALTLRLFYAPKK